MSTWCWSKSSQFLWESVVKETSAAVYSRGDPEAELSQSVQKSFARMSERCNLKTLTAALCCFYQKNSVISAKVREDARLWSVFSCHSVSISESTSIYVLSQLLMSFKRKTNGKLCRAAMDKSMM